MGFFEDLGKELDKFANWLVDTRIEEYYTGEELIREEIDWKEYNLRERRIAEYYDEEPELLYWEEVEDSYYAPVADFFENLEKGTDEEVSNFVGELLGRPEEEDDDEEWFEYFAHLGFGYWNGERRESEERTFFSTSPNKKAEIRDIMENDYGRRDLYMGYGIGGPVVVDVTDPYPVDKSEVDENEII